MMSCKVLRFSRFSWIVALFLFPAHLFSQAPGPATVSIPGSLQGFQRMTAVSRKAGPDDLLPFMARNVVIDGYQRRQGQDPQPTEYLKLIKSYLDQARELKELAGSNGMIRVNGCQDIAPLLKAIGFRFRNPCGPTATVETDDPRKAFLTVDSGFPITEMEEDLRAGKPFTFAYHSFEVPVIFTPRDWNNSDKDFVNALLDDPQLSRLYWAFSRLEEGTREQLRKAPGLTALLPHAAVLDFYGSHLYVRNGRVVVPGGRAAEDAWKSLVGASQIGRAHV